MSDAERRIPVQYAKRVVGRKMYGGQNSSIPIKVTMSGVMPIIFASALVSIPSTVMEFMSKKSGLLYTILSYFSYRSVAYSVVYVLLIIAFSFFYISITYNPIEMANNLRKNSGTIPGIRPGKPTSDFISRILSRINLIGGIFLAILAILPTIIGAVTAINLALGGTTLLIVVGVAIDTSRQLESQMLMRHYKGFLE
jgi:preprotein translocase subunit SecY